MNRFLGDLYNRSKYNEINKSDMRDYFKEAGDLDTLGEIQNKQEPTSTLIKSSILNNVSSNEFVNVNNIDESSLEYINDYLSKVVSGKEFGFECELGTLCSGGSCIVTFEQLQEMVDDGSYNIIRAQCFNPEMISVKYEQYDKNLKMFK